MMAEIHSLLFVPAEERKLAKIGKANADAYIIDLEDSIASEEKDMALQRTVEFLTGCDIENLFVRVNHHRFMIEIEALRQFNVGLMLPKIENGSDYSEAEDCLTGKTNIALIESPSALMNANTIASIPWVTALAFGAEDFTVAACMANTAENLFVPKSLLSLAAKANHKKVYDTPCFQLQDERAFHMELQQALNLGFDGKLAIHPKQVEQINNAFMVTDPDHIRRIIEEYESSGKSVCEIDGRVYEKLHIDRLRKMLAIG